MQNLKKKEVFLKIIQLHNIISVESIGELKVTMQLSEAVSK